MLSISSLLKHPSLSPQPVNTLKYHPPPKKVLSSYNHILSLYKESYLWGEKKDTNSWALLLHSPQHLLTPEPWQCGFWPHHYSKTDLVKVSNDLLIAKPKEHFQCAAFWQFTLSFKLLLSLASKTSVHTHYFNSSLFSCFVFCFCFPLIDSSLLTLSSWCFQVISFFFHAIIFLELSFSYHPHSKPPKSLFAFQTFARVLKPCKKLSTNTLYDCPSHVPSLLHA